MSDLLPCPFCGGEAEIWRAQAGRTAWISCMGRCSVLVSKEYKTDAEAVAAWNTRALPAVQPDLTDPVVVHANMLRGTIAKPTLDQIIHLYGVDALCRALVPAICREAALDETARLGQEFDAALKGESHG